MDSFNSQQTIELSTLNGESINNNVNIRRNCDNQQQPHIFIIQQQQQQQPQSIQDSILKRLTFRTTILVIVIVILSLIAIRSLYKSFSCHSNLYSGSNDAVNNIFSIIENRRYIIEQSKKHNKHQQQQQQQQKQSLWGMIGLSSWSWCPQQQNQLKYLQANPFETASESPSLKQLNKQHIIDLLNSSNFKSTNNNNNNTINHQNRLEQIKNVCARYRLSDHLLSPWHSTPSSSSSSESCESTRLCPLMIDHKINVIGCFVPSVLESISFDSRTLVQKQNSNNKLISIIEQDKLVNNNNNTSYLRILFTKHPFVRLVDAFRKRFELPKFLPNDQPYIINNETMHVWTFEEWCEEFLLPIEPYQYDPLWAPIWTQCEPCFVKYDLVGHYETFINDLSMIISQLQNASIIVDDVDNYQQQSTYQSSYNQTRQYIQRLKPKTIMALYAKYYLDFELFGYTIDDIFK